jgi:hypothetical protein
MNVARCSADQIQAHFGPPTLQHGHAGLAGPNQLRKLLLSDPLELSRRLELFDEQNLQVDQRRFLMLRPRNSCASVTR